ncbi:MAG: glycoside hydrolase family 5 protein [Lachnospiraceae bacterium]|nr:glycoside hydrolase family 5 protein [Lachnospiraceae bacterium]
MRKGRGRGTRVLAAVFAGVLTICAGIEAVCAGAAADSEAEIGIEADAMTDVKDGVDIGADAEADIVADVETDTVTAVSLEDTIAAMQDLTAIDVVSEMKIGWNLGNTLDATKSSASIDDDPSKFETAWGNPVVTEELIDAVLDAGFNVVRIPVTWSGHFGEAPDYTITESWLDRVQEIVDYAYDKGAYVIVNMHHEDWNDPYYDSEETICEMMSALWSQIAERFEEYDEHLIFEAQNEPRKQGTSAEWTGGDQEGWDVVNAANQVFIDTIRAAGGCNPYRMLMIPGYAASSSSSALSHIEVPEDDERIIVSVHAYVPYNFALNTEGTDTWNNDTGDIDSLMSTLKELFIDNGIPVVIGEFGALNKDNESERAEWVGYYVSAAAEIGVPCLWWDNGLVTGSGERFGLISRYTYKCIFNNLLDAMMEAAGVER